MDVGKVEEEGEAWMSVGFTRYGYRDNLVRIMAVYGYIRRDTTSPRSRRNILYRLYDVSASNVPSLLGAFGSLINSGITSIPVPPCGLMSMDISWTGSHPCLRYSGRPAGDASMNVCAPSLLAASRPGRMSMEPIPRRW